MTPVDHRRKKPTVLRTVARSWAFLWQYRLPLVVAVIPITALCLTLIGLSSKPAPALVARVFTFVEVAWIWFMCISPRVTAPYSPWSRTFWNASAFGRFHLLGLLFVSVYFVCVFVPVATYVATFDELFVADELRRGRPYAALARSVVISTIHAIAFSIFMLIVARFLLIFPATNNCEQWSLLDSWRRTRGVTWRLWMTLCLSSATAALVANAILTATLGFLNAVELTWPAQVISEFTPVLRYAFIVAMGVGCLEVFFRNWAAPELTQDAPKLPNLGLAGAS